MPNHTRRTDQSPTQNIDLPCPTCEEMMRVVVQDGLYDGVVFGCINGCHRTSDFPQSELEDRAVTIALAERHEYEFSPLHRCGAEDR